MLTQIPLMLTWRCRDGTAEAIYTHYLRHAGRSLNAWLAQALPDAAAVPPEERPLQLYEGLPARSRERFLTAPETYRRIIRRPEPPRRGRVAFVLNSLWAEYCLLKPEGFAVSEPLWTALGDACFTPGDSRGEHGTIQQFDAPCLAGKIVVDAVSPYSYVNESAAAAETMHSPQEVRGILLGLEEAMRGMGLICPAARDLVTLVTRVLALRKNAADPGRFGSCSWSGHIGKIDLTNAHLERATPAVLANALVHEAIHSLLYMVELFDPFYVDDQKAVEFRLTSPWSGRTLPASSYLHACFVWFGLWGFWRLARETSVFPAGEVEMCLARASGGFRAGSVVQLLSPVRPYLSLTLLEALEAVEAAGTAQ